MNHDQRPRKGEFRELNSKTVLIDPWGKHGPGPELAGSSVNFSGFTQPIFTTLNYSGRHSRQSTERSDMIVFSMFIRYNRRDNNGHKQAIQLWAFIAKENFSGAMATSFASMVTYLSSVSLSSLLLFSLFLQLTLVAQYTRIERVS